MAEKIVQVVAHMETTAEKADKLVEICLGLIDPSRKDYGCIQYDLFQNEENPGKVTFIEQWESKKALDDHLNTPHLIEGLQKIGELVVKPSEVNVLSKLA